MEKKAFVRDEKKARSEKSCPIRKIGEESEEDLVIVISDDEENPAATPVLNMNDVDTLTGAEWLNDAVIKLWIAAQRRTRCHDMRRPEDA